MEEELEKKGGNRECSYSFRIDVNFDRDMAFPLYVS